MSSCLWGGEAWGVAQKWQSFWQTLLHPVCQSLYVWSAGHCWSPLSPTQLEGSEKAHWPPGSEVEARGWWHGASTAVITGSGPLVLSGVFSLSLSDPFWWGSLWKSLTVKVSWDVMVISLPTPNWIILQNNTGWEHLLALGTCPGLVFRHHLLGLPTNLQGFIIPMLQREKLRLRQVAFLLRSFSSW